MRRIAQELGVDLASLSGTGPNGRITEDDVRGAGGEELVLQQHKPSEGRREPLRGVRRQIVEHLTRGAPRGAGRHVRRGVRLHRRRPEAARAARRSQAAAASLKEFPELNARLEGDEIVYLDRYDLGVAVQTDQGLVVPVVRGCDTASLEELAAEVDAARRGRAGRNAEAGGATRRHVHGHERRQARRPLRDAARQPPRGRHPRHPPDRPAPRRPSTARSSSATSATSRSRSTIASSTGRGRRRSRWT